MHEMLLKVPTPLIWSLKPYDSMKDLFRQMTYLWSQRIDFKNLKEFWKLKRFCKAGIELISKFLSFC